MATKRGISVAASSMKACKSRKLTSKILKEAYAQQREIENEEMSAFFKEAVYGYEDFIDAADEQSAEDFQSQFDHQDNMTSENDDADLVDEFFFNKDGTSIANRISDAISCIKKRDDKDDDATYETKSKAVELFRDLGNLMSVYTQGKMPKALNYIITTNEDLLKLTQPENWSPNAMHKATCMFASSKKAGHFYEFFLLPRVIEDIRTHDKLQYWLHRSLVKALYKPMEFYSGIVIPLCKSGSGFRRQAEIIGAVMKQFSIPEKYSSVALVCLAEMEISDEISYFIKVILDKKYALPYRAVDAVTAYFLRFHKVSSDLVHLIWHQTLLSFVQWYKHELRKEDKQSLRSLLVKHNHKLIKPEIVRELDNSRNRGEKASDSPSHALRIRKPIKEDLFDMPQVPMEED